MRSKKKVRQDFTASTQKLLKTLQDFPEAEFNTTPGNGQWSAGQVADHLIKTEVAARRFFTQTTQSAERDPEEKMERIKNQFLDFDKKFNAYGPIVPDDTPMPKQKVMEELQDNRQRLTGMIDIEDLSRIITVFEHPLFGPLTRIEWLYFQIYHSQRHCHQIDDIYKNI